MKNYLLRKGREIEIDGESATLAEWCRSYGVSKQLVIDRVKRGWCWEKAITTPARKYRGQGGFDGAGTEVEGL